MAKAADGLVITYKRPVMKKGKIFSISFKWALERVKFSNIFVNAEIAHIKDLPANTFYIGIVISDLILLRQTIFWIGESLKIKVTKRSFVEIFKNKLVLKVLYDNCMK